VIFRLLSEIIQTISSDNQLYSIYQLFPVISQDQLFCVIWDIH